MFMLHSRKHTTKPNLTQSCRENAAFEKSENDILSVFIPAKKIHPYLRIFGDKKDFRLENTDFEMHSNMPLGLSNAKLPRSQTQIRCT